MSRPLVLVANDPTLYREAIAVALREVRPEIETIAVDPNGLADDIARYRPEVAICSTLTRAVEAAVPSWVLLSPGGSDAAVTSVVGQRQETASLRIVDLVAFVDEAAGVGSQGVSAT